MASLTIAVTAVGCGEDAAPVAGTTSIEAGGVAFTAVIREPSDVDDAPLTVLFLHGASYTSRIWAERGVLDHVADAGHRAVAVDLPGSGGTKSTEREPADLLADLVEKVAPAGEVVLVSPSASGRYSLAFLAQRPEVELAGFVAVAPVGIGSFTPGNGIAGLPALLIWGEDDDVIPLSDAEALQQQLPGSHLVVLPAGSHAPYDDEPDTFIDTLVTFLGGIRP